VSLQISVTFYLDKYIERMLGVHVGVEVKFFNTQDPAQARGNHSEAKWLILNNVAFNNLAKELAIHQLLKAILNPVKSFKNNY